MGHLMTIFLNFYSSFLISIWFDTDMLWTIFILLEPINNKTSYQFMTDTLNNTSISSTTDH